MSMSSLTLQDSQPGHQRLLLCFYFCFSISQSLQLPTTPGSLILITCLSCLSAHCHNPSHTFSSFPDCLLASSQAISSVFLNKPFSSSELQSNFLFLCECSQALQPQSSFLSLESSLNTVGLRAKTFSVTASGVKEQRSDSFTEHIFGEHLLFFLQSFCCWSIIMSKTHIVPALREPKMPNMGTSQMSYSQRFGGEKIIKRHQF